MRCHFADVRSSVDVTAGRGCNPSGKVNNDFVIIANIVHLLIFYKAKVGYTQFSSIGVNNI